MHAPQPQDDVWPQRRLDQETYDRYKAKAKRLRDEAMQGAIRRWLTRLAALVRPR